MSDLQSIVRELQSEVPVTRLKAAVNLLATAETDLRVTNLMLRGLVEKLPELKDSRDIWASVDFTARAAASLALASMDIYKVLMDQPGALKEDGEAAPVLH